MSATLALHSQNNRPAAVGASASTHVGSDNKRVWRAIADTAGKSDPERALHWLEKLTEIEHRGRHDTWTAARDRAAEKAGAPISKTKRLWERWQTMSTVCGSVMVPLMLAYEELCERIEAKADEYERQRLQIKEHSDAAVRSPVPSGAGVVAAAPRAEG